MDKEHVKGAADNVAGKTKELAGHVTGNKKLETEGKVDQVKGAVHNAAGDAKDAGKEAIKAVKNAPSSIDVGVSPHGAAHHEQRAAFRSI
jgi:uncharacterized protein YjbJ (UPF0337 family)